MFVGLDWLVAQEYYYFEDKRVPIVENKNGIYLSFYEEETIKELSERYSLKYIKFDESRFNRYSKINKQIVRYECFIDLEQSKVNIENLRELDKVVIAPSYIVDNDTVYSSAYFYLCLKSIDDYNFLLQFSEENAVRIVSQDRYMPEWFTLAITEKCNNNAVEVANRFYETGLFKYVEPDWRKNYTQHSNDSYYTQQWGLKNTGQHNGISGIDINIESAWNISKGDDVVVAIIDQGIQLDHPDLLNNIYPMSYDAENDIVGSSIYGGHGTSCAGIVGAIQNNIGISGVSPQCKLMSISISLTTSTPLACYVNAINWAWENGADVLSNSYGGMISSTYMIAAINNAVTNGRNGLGCPVLFSSGNAKRDVITGEFNDDSYVRYPASLPNTIAVGAMSPCGERKTNNSCDGENWWKSCYGAELDVVAPGVLIPTTTINSNYVNDFNGTSAACPHAAGVMALMLSVNPCLTVTEARAILCKSCDKLSDYKYCNSTYGFWNNEVGYGKINAYKAVLMALGLAYENQFTGNVGQPTSNFQWILSNGRCTGLATSAYSVQRYEVTKTITFPYMENPIVEVSTNGYSAASPNQGNNYYNITNITHTSADVKTWKYKIITNTGAQTYIPNGDVYFKYIVFDATAPTVYVTNKTVNNTTYNSTAIETLNISNFTVQNNSNVKLRAGDEIVFGPTTSIKPTSTGIVHAKAAPFVSCEYNRDMLNEPSNLLANESVLKSYEEEQTLLSNDMERDVIPVVLFPNPTKDEIIVRYNEDIGEDGITITICNSSGGVVDEIKATNRDTYVKVLNYVNGVYIVKIENQGKVYSKVFIKQ